jgi:hypothetical protein
MRALGKRAERLSQAPLTRAISPGSGAAEFWNSRRKAPRRPRSRGAANWLLMAVENPIRYGYTRSATSIMGCDVK